MPRGAWSRQGTGTLTASAILFIVIVLVVGFHLASTSRLQLQKIESKVKGQFLLHASRAATEEAKHAFITLVNDEDYKKPDDKAHRLYELLGQRKNGAFLDKKLIRRSNQKLKKPAWVKRFREEPKRFLCHYIPRWTRRYFGSKKEQGAFRCNVGEVKIECSHLEKRAGSGTTFGKLRFSCLSSSKTAAGRRILRSYEITAAFQMFQGADLHIQYLADKTERVVDKDLLKGDRR